MNGVANLTIDIYHALMIVMVCSILRVLYIARAWPVLQGS